MMAHIISYEPSGDKILLGVSSKQLQKQGWKYSCKNIPASYLTGLLLGQKAKENKIKEAILDLGLLTPIKGSRLYALLKGAIDSGLSVPCSEDIFPDESRISGDHISEKVAKDFKSIKSKLVK